MNKNLNSLKAFGMTNQMILEDLTKVQKKFSIELGHLTNESKVDDTYYPQFDSIIRSEASSMSKHYEVFYCLEKSIRLLVSEIMKSSIGAEWWNSEKITEHIKLEVKKRIKSEVDSGMTRRSLDELDYTTFGELSIIINSNWEFFGSLFESKKAVERIMSNLNSLRGPIAHCSPLAEDEVLRLALTLRDWFRLME